MKPHKHKLKLAGPMKGGRRLLFVCVHCGSQFQYSRKKIEVYFKKRPKEG